MAKVDITKGAAIEHAKAAGVAVGPARTENRITEIRVGRFTVYWDRSQGGCGCWRAKDDSGDHFKTGAGYTQIGYVGEMILAAAEAERAAVIAESFEPA